MQDIQSLIQDLQQADKLLVDAKCYMDNPFCIKKAIDILTKIEKQKKLVSERKDNTYNFEVGV